MNTCTLTKSVALFVKKCTDNAVDEWELTVIEAASRNTREQHLVASPWTRDFTFTQKSLIGTYNKLGRTWEKDHKRISTVKVNEPTKTTLQTGKHMPTFFYQLSLLEDPTFRVNTVTVSKELPGIHVWYDKDTLGGAKIGIKPCRTTTIKTRNWCRDD